MEKKIKKKKIEKKNEKIGKTERNTLVIYIKHSMTLLIFTPFIYTILPFIYSIHLNLFVNFRTKNGNL